MKYAKLVFILGIVSLFSASGLQAELPRSPSPERAEVYIISPMDGETVSSPVLVQFGLKGMGIAPAGIDLPDTGHHHLLIDADGLASETTPMPMSDQLMHFGKGQTEVELELEPGTHTLQLVLGDYLHIPHDPIVASETITITVK